MNIAQEQVIKEKFATNLRDARIAVGLTQEEVAFHLDIHFSIISRYESGKFNPSLIRLFELAEVLGCDVNLLLGA